jgi:hypothetical protein
LTAVAFFGVAINRQLGTQVRSRKMKASSQAKIAVASAILLFGIAPSILQAGEPSKDDIRIVSEWVLFSDEASKVMDPVSKSLRGLDYGKDDDSATIRLAKMESSFRELRRVCDEVQKQLKATKESYRTEPVLGALRKMLSAVAAVQTSVANCIKIFEEVGGDRYKFLARQSDIMHEIAEMGASAQGLGKEYEAKDVATVRHSAERLLTEVR